METAKTMDCHSCIYRPDSVNEPPCSVCINMGGTESRYKPVSSEDCKNCKHYSDSCTYEGCLICGYEPKTLKKSSVCHPSHYAYGNIEVWDAIIDWGLDFVLGNVVKYTARAGHKGNKLEDLEKAREYIEKAILVEQAKEGEEQ